MNAKKAKKARQSARQQRAIAPGVPRINPWFSGEKADEIDRLADELRDYDAQVFMFATVRDRHSQVDTAVAVDGLSDSLVGRRVATFIQENNLGRLWTTSHMLSEQSFAGEPDPLLICGGCHISEWLHQVAELIRGFAGNKTVHVIGSMGTCEIHFPDDAGHLEWGEFQWLGGVVDVSIGQWVAENIGGNVRELLAPYLGGEAAA